MAQLVAEAGRLPPSSLPLGIVLFLPVAVGKSIFVDTLTVLGLTVFRVTTSSLTGTMCLPEAT